MTRRPRRPRDAGSGTVLAVTLVAMLSLVALVLAGLGGLLAQHRRLESAADLAALAGAAAVQHGRDGCAAADLVARRNAARLSGCRTASGAVEVTTTGEARLPFGMRMTQRARARAGPIG